MQERRDAWMGFQKPDNLVKPVTQGAAAHFAAAIQQLGQRGRWKHARSLGVDCRGVIDDQILASRLAMRVLEKSSSELNELRLRIQHLEKRQELPRGERLLPDVVARILVDQWIDLQMGREGWQLVQDALAPVMVEKMLAAYKAANEFLVSSGVMKEIDLQSLVKRAPAAAPRRAPQRRRP
ncbi:MAG: DUF1631 family protein [Burkholderiaceae bacterium]